MGDKGNSYKKNVEQCGKNEYWKRKVHTTNVIARSPQQRTSNFSNFSNPSLLKIYYTPLHTSVLTLDYFPTYAKMFGAVLSANSTPSTNSNNPKRKLIVAGRVKDPFFQKARLVAEVCFSCSLLYSTSLYL